MLPAERPGDFAEAMMDLGATICTPRTPVCALCPLAAWCAARRADPAAYPVRPAKRARQTWHGAIFVPRRPDGTVLLRRRPPRGLLGGMLEFFGSAWGAMPQDALAAAPFAADWREAGQVEHGFTHATLTLSVYRADVPFGTAAPAGGAWHDPVTAGLPTLMAKVAARALG